MGPGTLFLKVFVNGNLELFSKIRSGFAAGLMERTSNNYYNLVTMLVNEAC